MSRVRPIFLVGCARSGTTLLSVMMHAHPRIAMPPETRFLIRLYRNRARFGDLTVPANRRKLAWAMTRRSARFGDLGLDRDAVMAAVQAAPPTYGSAAGTLWREFAHSRGKARWGEKRPAYWRDMDVVMRLFPDAQVIHLVRDGRSCVASLKKVHWYRAGVIDAMVSWSVAERQLTRLGRQLSGGSYHRLRYEDLLADPRGELGRLCAFLGEDFDERMLQFSGAAGDIVPDRKTWHDRTRGGIDTERVEAWRSELTPDEIGLMEFVNGPRLRRDGYHPSGVGTRPRPRDIADFHRIRTRKLAKMALDRALDARQRRQDGVELADLG